MGSRQRILLALDVLQKAQVRLAAIALILIMLVTVIDVSMRYAFNSPLRGSYELVESLLLVFVFHGMSAAFLRRQNIVIDIIDAFAPRRGVVALIRLSDLLNFCCLLLIGAAMMEPAAQAFAYGDTKIELRLPLYVLWTIAFAGLGGAVLCAIGALWRKPAPDSEVPHP
jgi:TRAP-type C4-dicarboxylate transport system permease small subunit